MADKKISALTASTTPLAGTEVLPIVQSGSTVKVAVSDLTAGRAVSAASLALTGSPLPVASGGTGRITDGPAFSAYMINGSANQTITSATFTKIKIDTEEFDTANCFDTSLYRFTPNVAGYYQISGVMGTSGSTTLTRAMLLLYKNGASYKRFGDFYTASTGNTFGSSTLVYMNGTTDYLELYAYISAITAVIDYGSSVTWFTGSFVRNA